jgi:polysaccharide biosynthesis/export protein
MIRRGICPFAVADSFRKVPGAIILLLALSLAAPIAVCQTPQSSTTLPPSELARQNYSRVAASAAEIKKVLVLDTGLMVELKEWVAKDATDHGQLVSDSDLTDQAIYDRLETDVQFRSVATALLQKYGYLLPQINPASPQAKQQELLLEQRTKWIVQEEEEARSKEHQEELAEEQKLEETRYCEEGIGLDCPKTQSIQGVMPNGERMPNFGIPSQPEDLRRTLQPNAPGSPFFPIPPVQRLEQTQLIQPSQESPLGISGLQFGNPLAMTAGLSGGFGDETSQMSSLEGGSGGLGGMFSQNASPFGGQQLGGSESGVGGAFNSSMSSMFGLGAAGGMGGMNPLQAAMLANGGSFSGEAGLMASTSETDLYSQRDLYNFSQPSRMMLRPAVLNQGMVRENDPYLEIPSLFDMYLQAVPQPAEPRRFGMEVFQNGTRDLDMIPMDLPVGPNYVVGPGDALAIDMWGGVSRRIYGVVDREGHLSLPESAPVLVAGKTLAEVQQTVQQTLRGQFRDVSADVSLSRLRTIRVYVVGDVDHPGAYDISSLSTPLNALFAADGPTAQGSLRTINHYRGNQLVQSVDVYDLLLRGVKNDILPLQNGDTIQVPPIGPEVTVEGMVRRPAIYELHGEKSLSDVLALAGGLLPTATLRHIEVQRVVAHEKKTMLSLDIPQNDDAAQATQQLNSFQVQDGDSIRIFPIAPYNQDAVYLEGHVLRPGKYSYHDGMRVTDLVSSYKDLLPEPAGQYGEIIHLNAPDYHPTVESFNLADALAHPATAPILQPLDTVQIFGRYDFENPPTVSVGGDVRAPGTYTTSGQIHLSDAIHLAGGLAPDAEDQDAQVFRYLPDGKSEIFSVDLSKALAGDPTDNIVLDPRDRILVHRNPEDVNPASVYIKGQVARPGRYPLTSNMSIADLIHAAGGLQPGADLQDADLTHYEWNGQKQIIGKHDEVNLSSAMASNGDPPLSNGDVLTIRQMAGWEDLGASISVRGEVQHPGAYGIKPGERLSSILQRAGGFSPDAYPYGAILERTSVRELENKSQQELYERVKGMEAQLTAQPASDAEQKLAQETTYEQWQSAMEDLADNPPLGRVTIQISSNIRQWASTTRDIQVRDGDTLIIPKRPSQVMVQGQVYNPTAVTFRPGKSAKWYLSQSGGPTNLANKKAIFVVRADGTVIGGHGGMLWMGGGLDQTLQPGDTVVVPEKALGGPKNWQSFFQVVQVLSGVATSSILAASY